ncbi:ferritin [bacterium]|nr:ferritin [candidate division CSSED10-310 bacterium]
MIKNSMVKALNDQINEEMFSSYLYLAMAAQCEAMSLSGFANWMRVQAQEELFHAMKFFGYIAERGGRVELSAIAQPQKEWPSLTTMFEAVYTHECHISECINQLVDLAIQERDYATQNMLQWFVQEQVEEESSADAIVQKMKLVGDAQGAMFMMDRELGTRVFNPPAKEE